MAWTIDRDGMVLYDDGLFWKLALPIIALPVQLLIGGAFIVLALVRGAAPSAVALGLGLGFTLWTLFEYAVHRWLFHQTGNRVLRWIYVHAHRPHHRTRRMDDPHHRTLHPFIAVPSLLPHYVLSAVFGSSGVWAGAVAGFSVGYCVYEWFHYIAHGTDWPQRLAHVGWIRRKQSAHANHHFEDPKLNFGFTTSFWDRVFQTYDPIPR
jgi:sterol desaturase/sphingolipid hydroxylase (fatty acid hydroxylase superfamily)